MIQDTDMNADFHNGPNLGLEPPAAPQGEPSDIAAKLKDPNIVHVNMLRGTIAPITFDALAHVLGDDAKREWLAAQASSLQQDVEALLLMLENGEYAEHWAKTENGKRLEAAMTALHGKLSAAQAPAASAEPSDEEIDSIAASMPDGLGGMLKQWGYRQFARALLARYGRPAGDAQPVAWVAVDTLNSPHPGCVSSLAYVSQLDKDRGREYVPLYAAMQLHNEEKSE